MPFLMTSTTQHSALVHLNFDIFERHAITNSIGNSEGFVGIVVVKL